MKRSQSDVSRDEISFLMGPFVRPRVASRHLFARSLVLTAGCGIAGLRANELRLALNLLNLGSTPPLPPILLWAEDIGAWQRLAKERKKKETSNVKRWK